MANPGSRGKVIYADGCEINVSPGSVYTVQDGSPCRAGLGSGSARTYVIGGLVIVGGTVAIIALTGGDDGSAKKEGTRRAATIRRAPKGLREFVKGPGYLPQTWRGAQCRPDPLLQIVGDHAIPSTLTKKPYKEYLMPER